MNFSASPFNAHFVSRLTAWTRHVLMWVWMAFEGARTSPRHRRQRGHLSLDHLAFYIARAVVFRAIQNLGLAHRPCPRLRLFAIPGFKQRTEPRDLKRAAIGAWLRRQLRHRDPRVRLALMARVLTHMDDYVARTMHRLRGRLTRLLPRIVRAPHADALVTLAMPMLEAADSS